MWDKRVVEKLDVWVNSQWPFVGVYGPNADGDRRIFFFDK
jgi:hypothetical protein